MQGRLCCFNTQPPEGGWPAYSQTCSSVRVFQHTAARRRLAAAQPLAGSMSLFQHTAARRRLDPCDERQSDLQCFNTQPPEGGWIFAAPVGKSNGTVSTHSRPKAAGTRRKKSCPSALFQHTAARRRLAHLHQRQHDGVCFNTQPPEGGWLKRASSPTSRSTFQHTAARRRLAMAKKRNPESPNVSTHSRPKAAGASLKSLAPSGFAAPISLSSQKSRNASITQPFPLHLHSQYPDC